MKSFGNAKKGIRFVKQYSILTLMILLSGCATTYLAGSIKKYEHPKKEFQTDNREMMKFSGEYNGVIKTANGHYYEYIFYDVIDRISNGNIQILINVDNKHEVYLNEIDYKKKDESDSTLYYNYVGSVFEVDDNIGNDIYLIPYIEGDFGMVSQFYDQGRIIQSRINLKYQNRSLPAAVLFRFGYLFSVPIDIATSPLQFLFILIFFDPALV